MGHGPTWPTLADVDALAQQGRNTEARAACAAARIGREQHWQVLVDEAARVTGGG